MQKVFARKNKSEAIVAVASPEESSQAKEENTFRFFQKKC